MAAFVDEAFLCDGGMVTVVTVRVMIVIMCVPMVVAVVLPHVASSMCVVIEPCPNLAGGSS